VAFFDRASSFARALSSAWDAARAPGLIVLTSRFYAHLRVDESWDATVREAAERGPVVFVLRGVSAVDALAIAHVGRQGLPPIGFTHDLPWLSAALRGERRPRLSQEQALARALEAGETSILFLKRRPGVMTRTGRGRTEGDDLLASLLEHARKSDRDVTLVPVTLLWTLRAETQSLSTLDAIFGTTDLPGDVRAAVQLLMSYDGGALRLGEPVRVREFLESQEAGTTDYTLVRRLTYLLLRRVLRERRSAVGPTRKTPERVREEVLRSPKVTAIANDLAGGDETKRAEIEVRARQLVDELAADPNPDVLRALEQLLDAMVRRLFSGVDVDPVGVERLREAARRGTVVLLPSHKSHVDYVVLSYVLRKNLLELPIVAAGDNLAFFPIGEVLRRGGAFFIRRDFRGDRLYAAIVDAYVRKLLRDGWAIEFYLEGGRSRTGKLLTPKVGLLNLVVDAAMSLEGRSVAFIPVSIGYERMMEDFELAQEKAGAKKQRESARSLLAVADALGDPYGRVSVRFGEPIDLGELREQMGIPPGQPSPAKRRSMTNRIASLVVRGIHASSEITAGSLVATALLDMPGRGLSHRDLVAECARLLAVAARAGAHPTSSLVHADGRVRESAVRDAATVFFKGGLVKRHVPDDTLGRGGDAQGEPASFDDVVYALPEEARSRLDLVKNQILHFFADRALVAVAFLSARARAVPVERLSQDSAEIGQMLSHDLIHFADGPIEDRVEATIAELVEHGELARQSDTMIVGPGDDRGDALAWLHAHAAHLVPALESYRVAARTLRVLFDEKLELKALVARALAVGRDMFLGGEIDRREAVSGPTIHAAFEAFVERGLLARAKNGYVPADGATPESVRALEAYLAAAAPRGRGVLSSGGGFA
jgi:glycerol-3-phosphate O-acyltransferase